MNRLRLGLLAVAAAAVVIFALNRESRIAVLRAASASARPTADKLGGRIPADKTAGDPEAEVSQLQAQIRELDVLLRLSPRDSWQNRGNDTAEHAIESFLWALAAHDRDALAGIISLDMEGKARALVYAASLPQERRSSFTRPEDSVAAVLASPATPVPSGYRIVTLGYSEPGSVAAISATVHLATPSQQEANFVVPLRRTVQGWRVGPIESPVVERLLRMLDPATGEVAAPDQFYDLFAVKE